ncbi:MAG: transglycosylase SLT domain-containing protein [Bdellovibrionales bacterium]|nr:transglycosylase SLT domain-containing protein [Bdellovibrionales bacterium]
MVKAWGIFSLLGLTLLVSGCVGPTTPFGALEGLALPKKNQSEMLNATNTGATEDSSGDEQIASLQPTVEFSPGRQILHRPIDFRVTVKDPESVPESAQLRVYYNGYNVSKTFLKQAIQSKTPDNKEWTFTFKKLPLLPSRNNHVRFIYARESKSELFFNDLKPPECLLYEDKDLVSTGQFSPPPSYLQSVVAWSSHHHINPALLAGLIAQESSFDPNAVSWAKAVGLTQVTNLADVEIAKKHPEWPRSERIKKYPASVVKTLIATNEISREEDWRLNPELSVRGGIAYLEYLNGYWTRPQNYSHLNDTFKSPNQRMTDVVLASYNSGAARVKKSIEENGKDYLESPQLGEAKKYVNRINSLCYYFSTPQKDKL